MSGRGIFGHNQWCGWEKMGFIVRKVSAKTRTTEKNSMKPWCIAMILTAAALAGCGEDVTVTEQPLSGMVGGQQWTFQKGDTNAFLSDADGFFASLYAEDFAACGFGAPSPPMLLISVPTEIGEYGFSLSRNMTFVPSSGENLVATEGVIVVEEITADTIYGGLHGIFDGDNEVDGTFALTICAE
jgi:hypothetical protein